MTVAHRRGIRSPSLAALPRPSTAGRRQRVTARGMVFLLIGGLILTTVAVVVGRLAPREGWSGRLLYGLHDAVFLQIKGYAYTAFLPTSLIWWGFGALLLALVLASWLSDRSFLRRPHAAITSLLVRLPFGGRWLVGGVRWLRRRGLPCDLLRQMAIYEREVAARQVLTATAASAGTTRRAIRLTRLAIDLQLLPPVAPSASVQAAVFLVEGLLAARLQRQDGLVTPLLEIVPLVAGGLRAARTAGDDDETGLTLTAFARDLELLAEIQWRLVRLAQTERGRRGQLPAVVDVAPRSRLRELAVAVDARRDVLEQARSMVETRRLYARGGSGGEGDVLANHLPDLPAEGLALAGRLTLDIALLVADLGQAAGLAEASLEAVEALALSLQLRAATQEVRATADGASQEPSVLEARLIGLVDGLPRPEQYAICARLGASDPHGRLGAWAARASAGGVIHPEDLEIIRERQAALQLAGGPDA